MKLLAALLALAPIAALANPVDFSAVLLGQDGKPIPECLRANDDKSKCIEQIDLTLGWLSRFALDATAEREMPTASDIIKRGTLAEKIRSTPKLDLSVDEAKLLKDQIIKLPYKPLIKYQALQLIDPKGTEAK